MRRGTWALAGLLVVAVVVAGCGSSGKQEVATRATPGARDLPTVRGGRFPLLQAAHTWAY